MARFSVGRDEEEHEDRRSNNRPLPKRARTSNSGNPEPTSVVPDPQLPREEPAMVEEDEEESEDDGSEEESETSWSGSSESEEEEDAQEINAQVQPVEARRNSGRNSPVSVTLNDPDVLDCPICLESLSSPVFQCENGHLACGSCCIKMRNKCASCSFPIGYSRCRAIEKVIESLTISCQNKKYGCNESLIYSKKLEHEKACKFSTCSCPHLGCEYFGLPKCLYAHFTLQHPTSFRRFRFNYTFPISMDSNQKHAFFQEKYESFIFIVSRAIDPHLGSFVNIICIAPNSLEREFFYDLIATDGVSTVKVKTLAEKTPRWISQPPAKKYLVPNDIIESSGGVLKLEITLWRDVASMGGD